MQRQEPGVEEHTYYVMDQGGSDGTQTVARIQTWEASSPSDGFWQTLLSPVASPISW